MGISLENFFMLRVCLMNTFKKQITYITYSTNWTYYIMGSRNTVRIPGGPFSSVLFPQVSIQTPLWDSTFLHSSVILRGLQVEGWYCVLVRIIIIAYYNTYITTYYVLLYTSQHARARSHTHTHTPCTHTHSHKEWQMNFIRTAIITHGVS